MKRLQITRHARLAWCAAALLSACGTSAPTHFYSLAAVPAAAPESQPHAPGVPNVVEQASVAITSVTVPDNLDRPQLVRFLGPEHLQLSEEARWSEPLAHGIGRTLADDLSARLGGAAVAAYPEQASLAARFRIAVDVSHLDVGDGEVWLEALWSVHDTGASALHPAGAIERGRTLVHQPLAPSSDPAAGVHAQSQALGRLADDLAAALHSMQQAP